MFSKLINKLHGYIDLEPIYLFNLDDSDLMCEL